MLNKEALLLTKTKSIFEITLGVYIPDYGTRLVRTVQMKVGDTVAAYHGWINYYDLPEECQLEAPGSMEIHGAYETQPSCFEISITEIEGVIWFCVTLVSAPRESSTFLFYGSYAPE